MTHTAQLPFAFEVTPRFTAEEFLVSPSNTEAFGWVGQWPDWPSYGLALYGPAACGKSHLASLWAVRAEAHIIPATALVSLSPEALPRETPRLVIEDLNHVADETRLFHLLNTIKENGGHVLITATEPPARWGVKLPDLASRLAALPAVAIQPPDDALLAALLLKHFADRQLRPGTEAVQYLLTRIDRSFAAVKQVVERLDHASLKAGRNITVPLIKEVLGS